VYLFPLSLLLGILAGIAAGGRIGSLTRLRLRLPGIVIGALLLQSLLTARAGGMPAAARLALLAATYAVAGGWLLVNLRGRSRPFAAGLVLTGVGWLLNMVVVLANSGMPVSLSALARIGASPALLAGGGPLGKHLALGAGSTLSFLGDIIPVPALRSVVSIGDLVMIAGLVCAVAAAMRLPQAEAPAVPAAARPLAA
jgi:hypothetical protein